MTNWVKRLAAVLLISVSLCAGAKTISVDEMEKIFRTAMANPQLIEEQVRKYNLRGEKAQLLRDHMKRFSQEKRLVRYFVTQMEQFGLNDEETYKNGTVTPQYILNLVVQLQQGLVTKGLAKADDEMLDFQFRNTVRMSRLMSAQACRDYNMVGVTKTVLRESDDVDRRLYAGMSIAEMREFYSRQLQLVRLGLDETMPVRRLTDSEKELALGAFDRIVGKGLHSLPEREARRIAQAMVKPEGASARDVCDMNIFFFEQILRMNGQAKSLVMRLMIEPLIR